MGAGVRTGLGGGLNTDAARYGGGGVRNEGPLKRGADGIRMTLPPLATVWLRPA